MKKYFPAIVLCYLFSHQISATENFGTKNEIGFLENKGQVYDQYYKARPDILFSCEANSIVYFLKNTGISYQLSRIDSWKEQEDIFKIPLGKKKVSQVIDKMTIYRLDINWLNANKNCLVQKEDALEGYNNYYFGFCPDGVNHVKSYKNVTYKNIYNGIDLHYYSKNGNLKYDYIVSANTDHKQIQLKIDGAESITINKKGELVIKTPLGTIIEQAPLVKQNKKILKAAWLVTKNVVSFKIEGIDPKQPFVIDPMIRLWGTLCGGSGGDSAEATCVDASENVYIAGNTNSPSGVATIGSHQFTYAGGLTIGDALLVKFDKNGVRKWATYYGGSNPDIAVGCTTDKNRNIFINGHTHSYTGIATPGAFQTTLKGDVDAFFAKFDSTGVRQWATYYGDTEDDGGSNCSTDHSGNIVFFGGTEPPAIGGTVLATPGAHQTLSPNSISPDGFIAKFNTNGQRLWGTYYGGSQYEIVRGGTVDKLGNVYITGITNSFNAIATPGSHQSVFPGITTGAAYLVKFDSIGVRQWATYYGGNSYAGGLYCCTDRSGNVYISGVALPTASSTPTDIATLGSHQSTFGGYEDAFLAKFSTSGARIWATYYGGDDKEEGGWACATDNFNNVYMGGTCLGDTLAQGAIATPDGFQNTHGNVLHNAYIVKFDSNGVRKWGTFYGQIVEAGKSCVADNEGYVYLAGVSGGSSSTIIASPGAHQTIPSGQNDAFLVKFFGCEGELNVSGSSSGGCFGVSTASAAVNVSGGIGYTYTWVPSGGNSNVASNLSTGIYTCFINNVCATDTSQMFNITQPTSSLTSNAIFSNTLICVGEASTLTLNTNGGVSPYSYLWSVSNNTTSSIIISPTITTIYTVTTKDINDCVSTSTVMQSVDACVGIREINDVKNKMLLYPNPNNGQFYISGFENNIGKNVEVYNSIGQLIKQIKIQSKTLHINMSEFPNGVYFVNIKEGNATMNVSKIIKD